MIQLLPVNFLKHLEGTKSKQGASLEQPFSHGLAALCIMLAKGTMHKLSNYEPSKNLSGTMQTNLAVDLRVLLPG